MKETVNCSAILTGDGWMIAGKRHSDCMQEAIRLGRKIDHKPESQGFLTTSGRYVTRKNGRRLQDDAGVLSVAEGGYRGEELYSEDLY